MFTCSRVELMVAVLAQMYLLNLTMLPYLTLSLVFVAVMVLVTAFVIYNTKNVGRSWPIPFLAVLRETRYILFPAMLMLTEQPYTQLALLIIVNILTIILCVCALLEDSRFKWSLGYLIVESVAILLIEFYMLTNMSLPLEADYFMISLMGIMVTVYAIVSIRLIVLGLKKMCIALAQLLKKKMYNMVVNKKDSVSKIIIRKTKLFHGTRYMQPK
jgi:hypothetical protein